MFGDDRTMHVGVHGFYTTSNWLSSTASATSEITVSAGSPTNQNPSSISFYVEYSDDLTQWTPLHSALDLSDTNTDTTVLSTTTDGLAAFFFDPHAIDSSHRFYRSVEVAQ